MKVQQVLLFSILALAFSNGVESQRHGRFIVELITHNNPSLIRCVGTVITANHVLAPASCVNGVERLGIGIRGAGSQLLFIGVQRVFTYPDFLVSQDRGNNVAVVQLVDNYRLNATEFPPRTLASLTDNTDCRLFGWGETGAELPRYETVRIRSPQNCNASLPRAFCTQFDAQFPAQCHAILGSPVVCGDGSVVSGFLVGSNGECVSTGNRTELFYHSVGQFQEWIERVTSAGTTDQISVLLSLSAFLVTLKNIL